MRRPQLLTRKKRETGEKLLSDMFDVYLMQIEPSRTISSHYDTASAVFFP
jgi:hypothetical protein